MDGDGDDVDDDVWVELLSVVKRVQSEAQKRGNKIHSSAFYGNARVNGIPSPPPKQNS